MNLFDNKKILLAIKVVLFVLMSWFIADQLFLRNDFKAQYDFFLQHLNTGKIFLLAIALALMPVNWGLETIKWKILLRTKSSFKAIFKSILAGIAVGFVTPGRTGEFIGRVLFIEEDDKAKAFYLSSIGGFAQTAASLAIGVPFVFMWHGDFFLLGVVTGMAAVYLFLFFRFDLLNRFISGVPFLQKNGLIIQHHDLPALKTQVAVLAISAVRFFVYLMQYVLLLDFLGVSSNYLLLMVHSVVFLLAQTFSPLMPLLDISYRGGSALYIFHNFSPNNIAILSAVMLVWIINLVIPAVTGYLFILRKKTALIYKQVI